MSSFFTAVRPTSSFPTVFDNTSFAFDFDLQSVNWIESETQRSCANRTKAPLLLLAPEGPSEQERVALPQTREEFLGDSVDCGYGLGPVKSTVVASQRLRTSHKVPQHSESDQNKSQRSRPSMGPWPATYLNSVNLSDAALTAPGFSILPQGQGVLTPEKAVLLQKIEDRSGDYELLYTYNTL